MPINNVFKFTDPITGNFVYSDSASPPPGWFILNGEVHEAATQGIIAKRIVSHPGITPEQVLSPYPGPFDS